MNLTCIGDGTSMAVSFYMTKKMISWPHATLEEFTRSSKYQAPLRILNTVFSAQNLNNANSYYLQIQMIDIEQI